MKASIKQNRDTLGTVKLSNFLGISKKVFILGVLGIVLGLSSLAFFLSGGEGIDGDKWQAVFLENNQVYFGRLTISKNFYVLSDVFYLQTEKGENELGVVASNAADIEDDNPNAKLVKLGNELHGPEDRMFIEKSRLLFWENLKDASTIVKSIDAYYQ